MKSYQYIACVLAVLLCTACSVTRNRAYTPSTAQLNIQMNDLEYLGQTHISVDYRTYLGFISKIDKINGQRYDGVETHFTDINGGYLSAPKLYSRLGRAAYKATEDFPQANYFVVVSQSKHKTRLFLGSEVSVKATVKAYSFK